MDFEFNVPVMESAIGGLRRSSVGSAVRVEARAGLACGCGQQRGVPRVLSLSVPEHETHSYIGRRVSVHSKDFPSLHLTLGSHVEQQGF